jgi:hypothetical protein
MNKVSVNSNTPPSRKRNCSVMEASNDSIDSGSIEDDLNQKSVQQESDPYWSIII